MSVGHEHMPKGQRLRVRRKRKRKRRPKRVERISPCRKAHQRADDAFGPCGPHSLRDAWRLIRSDVSRDHVLWAKGSGARCLGIGGDRRRRACRSMQRLNAKCKRVFGLFVWSEHAAEGRRILWTAAEACNGSRANAKSADGALWRRRGRNNDVEQCCGEHECERRITGPWTMVNGGSKHVFGMQYAMVHAANKEYKRRDMSERGGPPLFQIHRLERHHKDPTQWSMRYAGMPHQFSTTV
ncbi:hypothetical protein B0H21DRAFT_713812 [Amylocystis lapponica]|nr:hypothetical protein B0H21DRAFT_713812 [Amylocystis lapponica]